MLMLTFWRRNRHAHAPPASVPAPDDPGPASAPRRRRVVAERRPLVAIPDNACLERFYEQIELHRRYGWEVRECSENPPQAVLAPRPQPGRNRRDGGAAAAEREPRRGRTWRLLWIDDVGEVRWQSIRSPAGGATLGSEAGAEGGASG